MGVVGLYGAKRIHLETVVDDVPRTISEISRLADLSYQDTESSLRSMERNGAIVRTVTGVGRKRRIRFSKAVAA